VANLLDKKWDIAPAIPAETSLELEGYDPVLQQLLYNREIKTAKAAETYLNASGSLYDPMLLKDMARVTERLFLAVDRQEKIAIYGDYDVDGVTATALLVQMLKNYGAEVTAYFPDRMEEGYGLNKEALNKLKNDEGVGVVVTVDCGIRSLAEGAHAVKIGLDLIISDHHEPLRKSPVDHNPTGENELPEVFGIICPKQDGDEYPDKNLAGVGVAFKIAEALSRQRLAPAGQLEDLLDLVAVGTVADIVPLVGENRALVKAGSEALRRKQAYFNQPRFVKYPGLYSLSGAAGISSPLTARDIGFALGPRLNAAGRLESAKAAFNLLMAEDVSDSGILAQQLDGQNKKRQELTREMQETAEGAAQVSETDRLIFATAPAPATEDELLAGAAAVEKSFHMGVVGLVAARLTETHYLPSIVGAVGEEFTRASCRSIPEFNITQALDECKDLFVRHGGHAMAAGFTIRNERLDELKQRMKVIAERELGGKELKPVIRIDKVIDLRLFKNAEIVKLIKTIDALEPTGHKNREVLFVSYGLKVLRHRTVGSDSRHLKLSVSDGNSTYDAIGFRLGHWDENMPERVDLVYAYERNVFRGVENLQLNIRDLRNAD